MNRNHRSIVALQNSHIVQSTIVALQRFSVRLHTNDRTGIHRVVAFVQGTDGPLYLLCVNISQETQSAHIDAQDGNLTTTYLTGSTEECSIASHRNDKIGLKMLFVKHLYITYRQSLSCCQKSIELALNEHLGVSCCKTSQQGLNGSRLLRLIHIAKDGETKFS